MKLVHPRKRTLRRWLDSTGAHPLDEHVTSCARCATRLEELAAPGPDLRDALHRSLSPPEDLVERLGARMTDSMRNRRDLQIFLDLLGVPWRTVQTLMLDEEGDWMDDPDEKGRSQ